MNSLSETLVLLSMMASGVGCATEDPAYGDGSLGLTDPDHSSVDNDGDGYSEDEGDCDDLDDQTHPGTIEVCDGIDNDCDGVIDEGVTNTYYIDADSDGFGDDVMSVEACRAPDGYSRSASDCDDANDKVFPGNVEYCDELDNDCDRTIDEDLQEVFWADADGDGFGDPDAALYTCEYLDGYVANTDDCDDTSEITYLGADEICDELNNDCDALVDDEDSGLD